MSNGFCMSPPTDANAGPAHRYRAGPAMRPGPWTRGVSRPGTRQRIPWGARPAMANTQVGGLFQKRPMTSAARTAGSRIATSGAGWASRRSTRTVTAVTARGESICSSIVAAQVANGTASQTAALMLAVPNLEEATMRYRVQFLDTLDNVVREIRADARSAGTAFVRGASMAWRLTPCAFASSTRMGTLPFRSLGW